MNGIANLIYLLILRGAIVGAALASIFFIFILMLQEILRNERARNSK